jgi:aerobic-type carbon monoxide dehydrogenase small subunit (CoxS/CutS family)
MPTFRLSVNGKDHQVDTEPDRPLLDVLREDLDLTGTKYGCGEGQCRACTVLMDGRPVISCVTPVHAAAGKQITTIEGVERNGRLHPVQQAFLEEGALQCGYCTPGMVLRTVALLTHEPHPSEARIVESLNGNICRCNGYPRIIAAVKMAAAVKSAAQGKEASHVAE